MPEEIYNSNAVANPQRPFFLTVLCYITFIGSIAGIIVNAVNIVNANSQVETIKSGKSKTQLRNLFSSASTESTGNIKIGNLNEENYVKFSIGGIVSFVLCLVGTVLMYKLNRTGFYSFTLGTFFNLITHFLLFGDNFGTMGLSILVALSGFVFVILFSTKLDYMEEK
ncbi:MAG: hypothetical protein ABJB11_22940 [Ferruginibacter sp.]